MSVVLVTGCGSGIGRSIALHLARNGDTVFAGVRRPESADPLRAVADEGHRLTPITLDVDDPTHAERAVAEVLAAEGRIDALVNNAGISMFAAAEEVSDDDARAVFETNTIAPLRLMRAVLPTMRAQRSGTILNVSSLAGYAPRPYQSVYSASKHALDALSFSIASEVREFGIRVVVISPGRHESESVRNMRPPSIRSDEPEYRDIADRKIHEFATGSKGSDPVAVAIAIDECIRADRPPARVFVGDDSREYAEQRRTVTDDEYADVLAASLVRYQEAP